MKRLCRSFVSFLILFSMVSFLLQHIAAPATAADPATAGQDKITRFLVLGCDHSKRLTDSILLVAINETRAEARILQIPRDTYAEYTKGSYKKLNGAMQTLGALGMKHFLSQALGVKIDYFVTLKLDFFKALVDAVGGVEIEIDRDMDYSDPSQGLKIHLKAGKTLLDGETAEQFVRYRSGYVNADLGRLDAQKKFLGAFAKRCQAITFSQLLRVTGLALTGVQTDIDLPAAIRTVGILRRADADNIPMATLDGQAVKGNSGAWYYVIRRASAVRMIAYYLNWENDPSGISFDPSMVFDREENTEFHQIYTAE